MQLHVSPSMRSITISSSNDFTTDLMKIKLAARHISSRTLFHTILILAFLLPFVFILTALVTLEGVNKCSSIGKLKKYLLLFMFTHLVALCVLRFYWFGSGLDCVFFSCNDWWLGSYLAAGSDAQVCIFYCHKHHLESFVWIVLRTKFLD